MSGPASADDLATDQAAVERPASPARRRMVVAAVVAVMAVTTGVGVWWFQGPPTRPAPPLGDVVTIRDVEYHPTARLDVARPAGSGSWPIVVVLHGCCGGREDMFQLAHELASRGTVAITAGWHTTATGGTYPEVYEQVACAVRFARARGQEYGGDVNDVTVVGWSDGALLGSAVALSDDDGWQGDCPYSGSLRPDRFVGLAGFYGWRDTGDVGPDDGAVAFFGGTPSVASEAWAAGNPYALLGRHRSTRVVLMVGKDDLLVEDARCFYAALMAAGQSASLVTLPDAGHLELIAPRTQAGDAVVEVIVSLAGPATAVDDVVVERACR